jgi:hypothetical protein
MCVPYCGKNSRYIPLEITGTIDHILTYIHFSFNRNFS